MDTRKTFVRIVIMLAIAGIGFAAARLWDRYSGAFRLASESAFHLPLRQKTDLSISAAAKIARKELESDIIFVIPFRDTPTNKQFIVAIEKPEEDGDPSPVYVLSEQAGGFHTKLLRNPACSFRQRNIPLQEAVGVVDLRGDGAHQVFTVCVSSKDFEEGTPSSRMLLMDSSHEMTFTATKSTSFFPGHNGLEIEDSSEDPRFTAWFQSTAQKFDPELLFNTSSIPKEVVDWRTSNPEAWTGHRVNFNRLPGEPSVIEAKVNSRVNDLGSLKIYVLNGGPVIVYDRAQNVHYVLYVPAAPASSFFSENNSNQNRLVFSFDDLTKKEQTDTGVPKSYQYVIYDRQDQILFLRTITGK